MDPQIGLCGTPYFEVLGPNYKNNDPGSKEIGYRSPKIVPSSFILKANRHENGNSEHESDGCLTSQSHGYSLL